MARINTEERGEDQLELDDSLFSQEDEDTSEVHSKEPEPEPKVEDDLPDKYRGKTAIELVKMHQDAETWAGRQSNEIGQLRKVVDDFISAHNESSKAPEEPEPDFFENPTKATRHVIESVLKEDPRLKAIEQQNQVTQRNNSASTLQQKHPDANEIVADPAFGEWIAKSKVRMKMFQDAHNNYDVDMADELFGLWKERKSYQQEQVDSAKETRKESVRKASTGSNKASAETRGKPILSRDALVELKMKNPDKYFALLPEIKRAYREKRVR